ncbi:MAG: glycosyltransferase family 4 protein [Chloroflexi bacterium]|nr:glycosyltransferase family 4 protein [Chloroflexota bacterium]
MMRIALVSNRFYPSFGGVENSLYYMAQHLGHLGNEVIIFVGRHDEQLNCQSTVKGIKVLRYPYPLSKWAQLANPSLDVLAAARYWKQTLGQNRVDMVWGRCAYLCYAIQKAGFDGPIALIPPALGNLFYREIFANLRGNFVRNVKQRVLYLVQSPQKAYFERAAVKNVGTVVTFSENVASQMTRQYPFVGRKISVVRPGVDSKEFSPKERDLKLACFYGLNDRHRVFLYVGRLTPEKNIALLIEAFAMVEGDDNRLIIVGDGYHRHFLEQRCRDLGLQEKIIFTGYQENTSAFHSLAHFFVLPTLYEGFGQVYLEAMSSGVPCIGFAGKLTATSEIIKDTENGFIAYKHSPEALSRSMQRARTLDDGEYRRMCTRARNLIVENYRWEHFVSTVLTLSTR